MSTTFCLAVLLSTHAVSAGPRDGTIALPKPAGLDMSLGDALRARRSTRQFVENRELSRADLGAVLWAMTGVNRPDASHPHGGKRTAPSAYGSCAVDVLVTSATGTFRYSPKDHALVPHGEQAGHDLRAKLGGASWAKEAPAVLLLVADLERYPERVRPERRRDYSSPAAASRAQTLSLACAARGLGTVLTSSAASDEDAAKTLALRPSQRLLIVMPVGHPRAAK